MAAPKTVLTYPLNGSLKDFDVPFEYLARKFVVVTLVGATRRVLVLNSEYRFTTKRQITTTAAWGPAQAFENIEIRRVTSATERLVDFNDGSILRAYDLNTAQVQSLHIAEEARDLTADTIAVNNDGDLDARGRKLVNLADATELDHAVTLRQEQGWSEGALNSKNAAKVSEDNAKVSEASAASSKDLAGASKSAAEAAAVASGGYRDTAQKWAVNSEDSPVTPGLYSAYHYSRKASTSAGAASTSQGAALASASAASDSASAAATSATNAANSASALGSAISLYDKVENVTGNVITWKTGVTHKLGNTNLTSSGIINASGIYLSGGTGGTTVWNQTDSTPARLKFYNSTSITHRATIEAEATKASLIVKGTTDRTYVFKDTGEFTAPERVSSKIIEGTQGIQGPNLSFGLIGKEFGPLTIPAVNGELYCAHSLGRVACLVTTRYRCLVAQAGYEAGDWLTESDFYYTAATARSFGFGCTYSVIGTCTMKYAGPPVFMNKTTGAATTMTAANWEVFFTVMALAT